MKKMTVWLLGLMAGAVILSGCGKQPPAAAQPTNTPSAGGNPITAPVDYLGAVNQARKSSERKLDVVSLKQAIEQFQVAEERFPKSLDELVAKRYLGRLPAPPPGMKFDYDPQAGTVKVLPK